MPEQAKYLADQLTLFQPGGVASAHPFLLTPQNFLIEFQNFSLHNFLRRVKRMYFQSFVGILKVIFIQCSLIINLICLHTS